MITVNNKSIGKEILKDKQISVFDIDNINIFDIDNNDFLNNDLIIDISCNNNSYTSIIFEILGGDISNGIQSLVLYNKNESGELDIITGELYKFNENNDIELNTTYNMNNIYLNNTKDNVSEKYVYIFNNEINISEIRFEFELYNDIDISFNKNIENVKLSSDTINNYYVEIELDDNYIDKNLDSI